jgi:hypothetical protein
MHFACRRAECELLHNFWIGSECYFGELVIFAALHAQIRPDPEEQIWINQQSQDQSYGGNA